MVYSGKGKSKTKMSEKKQSYRNLVLHNDEVNSFEHVIDALCQVCEHDEIQAEQCAMITHFNGKCDVRKGTYEELVLMKDELIQRELNVTID